MDENELKTSKKEQNKLNIRASRRIKKVDLDYLEQQGKTILGREFKKLLDLSYTHKLSKDDQDALIKYMKYIKELAKEELEYLKSLPREELERLAALEQQEETEDNDQ